MDSVDSFLAVAKYNATKRRKLECGRCAALLEPHETFQEHNSRCPKNIKNLRCCRVCGNDIIKTEIYQHLLSCRRDKILRMFTSFPYFELERIWRIIDTVDDLYDIKLEDAIIQLCRASSKYDHDNRKLISILSDLDTPLTYRIHKQLMMRAVETFLSDEFSVDDYTVKEAVANIF